MEAALAAADASHRFGLIVNRADECLAAMRARERLARRIRTTRRARTEPSATRLF